MDLLDIPPSGFAAPGQCREALFSFARFSLFSGEAFGPCLLLGGSGTLFGNKTGRGAQFAGCALWGGRLDMPAGLLAALPKFRAHVRIVSGA